MLSDLRLQLGRGEVGTLVGASGCGKSTVLRLIAGLGRPDEGRVRLDGRAIVAPTPEIRFVFQEPRLFPWLDLASNVAFDLLEAGSGPARRDPRVATLLREVGLADRGAAWPKALSGGQAQRVAIARGLFAQPSLLLLDSRSRPSTPSPAWRCRTCCCGSRTVLMVTHDIDEAVQLSDRVLVMCADPGRVSDEISVDSTRPRDRDEPATPVFARRVRSALYAVHAF